jgi:hypothetical protein
VPRLHHLILSAALLLIAVDSSSAREWRGIVPLRSTRADVVRLLNQCSDQKEACRFTVGTNDVHILFSSGLVDQYAYCAAYLPAEAVMFIHVRPRAELKLSALRLDKRRLHQFNSSEPIDRHYKGYRTDDGLVVGLFKDRVRQIVYLPDESNLAQCIDFYNWPQQFIVVYLVHVPAIHALYGPQSIRAGEQLKISASSDFNETRGYKWTVSAGKIVAGQYTQQVTIDTTGLAGQTLIVSAEIGDHHTATSSIVVKILPD